MISSSEKDLYAIIKDQAKEIVRLKSLTFENIKEDDGALADLKSKYNKLNRLFVIESKKNQELKSKVYLLKKNSENGLPIGVRNG